jgi:hypothetical protein
MDGLQPPIGAEQGRALRRAVLDYVRSERRRVHPPVLHVGIPGGTQAALELDGEETDHSLRTDMVAAMLRRTARGPVTPIVWLARTGELMLQDVDARWLSAARTAYAEAGTGLTMVVLNRHGWRDPRSGAGRQWVRLRP